MEAAIQSQVKEDLAKSYREGDKVTMVHGGGNKASRFLEVSVFAKGGHKGVIWLPEGPNGRGGGDLLESLDVWWRARLR